MRNQENDLAGLVLWILFQRFTNQERVLVNGGHEVEAECLVARSGFKGPLGRKEGMEEIGLA